MSEAHKTDEEKFYDALSLPSAAETPVTTKLDDEIIDGTLEEQSPIKLLDDGEDEKLDEHIFNEPETSEEQTPELIDDDIDIEAMRESERSMSEEELERNKTSADTLKLEGNELFKLEQAEQSIQSYSEALKICPTIYTKERAILYGNRAAAKIKIESKKSAIDDCTKAIELWPEYIRVLLRRAKLYECEDKLDEALADYKRVLEVDASQREANEAVMRLPTQINERNERMKEEMLSKLKDLGNLILKPFGLSTNNFQMQQDAKTGGYSINFKQS